ncbi:MAG: glutamate--cysteine ligase [Oligoflexia bacterium]|nr:glutamate--cysteine ligase [Oligoflexia bacterium]
MSDKLKRMLASRIQKNRRALWDWNLEQARLAPPPFYCSIDLRDSGHKIVPVDSNLFPAGFNNICPEDMRSAPPIIRAQLDTIASRMGRPGVQKVVVIPESHTSNRYYLENLFYLCQLITEAGFECRIGWYGPLPEGAPGEGPIVLQTATEKELRAWPLRIENGLLSVDQFVPDLVLLNNDFSGGYPKELDLVTQPVVPSHTLGWHTRKKSEHFKYYNQLAGEFAKIIDVDPWHIQIDTEEVDHVNFNEDSGIDRAANAAEAMLKRIEGNYARHGVDHKPFVFVKNNAGTYGIGIMVVHSAEELRTMNRRTKNKMSVGKNRMPIGSVVVQEGVPTATLVDRLAAEPVIYLSGSELIGGFLRTNTERNAEENLNSTGMVFRKLCMSDLRVPEDTDEPDDDGHGNKKKSEPTLELVYGSIARISAFATGRELLQHARTTQSK